MWLVIGIIVGIVVLGAGALFGLVLLSDRRSAKLAREEEMARGRALGDWTVYYDVKAHRIGLVATFPESELLRYLLLRAHDLFDYNQGLGAEQQRIGEALRAAARGASAEPWQLLFPPPEGDCFHSSKSPQGTLFKFFDGTMFEHAVSQPRFMGGDSIAKQKGLVGECIAIAAHLSRDPARLPQVSRAIELFVARQLAEGKAPRGAKFWAIPSDALRAATG